MESQTFSARYSDEASRFATILAEGAVTTHAGMPPFEVRLSKWMEAAWRVRDRVVTSPVM